MQEKLKKWKEETGYTVREMGARLGVDSSHICRVMKGTKTLSKEKQQRWKEVRRLEEIIKENRPDSLLSKYELELLTAQN